MKKHILDFIKQGLMAAAGGPIVLAIIYGILGATGTVETLAPKEVSLGILTISLLAFFAGGAPVIYRVERIPLFLAIVLHGLSLYMVYIVIYLINGWLLAQWQAVAVFTGVFIGGFAVVWLFIYLGIRKSTRKLNAGLMGDK